MSGKEAYSLPVDIKERRERGSVLQLAAFPPVSGELTSVNTAACLSPAWWVPAPSPPALHLQTPGSSPTESLPHTICGKDFMHSDIFAI